MPYLHCRKCHHEWEGRANSMCDWCGAGGNILEEETPLERFNLTEALEEFYANRKSNTRKRSIQR